MTERETGAKVDGSRTVHVRVNAGGQRIVGWVDLPETTRARCSGILNDSDLYLTVKRDGQAGGQHTDSTAVNKETISYVEVVGERTSAPWVIPGAFEPVVIELSVPDVVLRGEVFVLADATVMDVLNDGRRFMSVRNAQFVDRPEAYTYLGVGKGQTRAVHF